MPHIFSPIAGVVNGYETVDAPPLTVINRLLPYQLSIKNNVSLIITLSWDGKLLYVIVIFSYELVNNDKILGLHRI